MGKRGPKPRDAVLTDTFDSNGASVIEVAPNPRQLKNTPPPVDGPHALCELGQKMWWTIVPDLENVGLFTALDLPAVARYCDLWARWAKAKAKMEELGEFYETKDENGKVTSVQQYPFVAVYNQCSANLHKMETSLGMNPKSRATLTVKVVNKPLGLNEQKAPAVESAWKFDS